MRELSVIVISFNTKDTTRDCLTKLADTLHDEKLESEIIVLDNNSDDESVEMIKEFANEHSKGQVEVKTLFEKQNLGFSKGNNRALKKAQGKYVLFLNSDVIINNVNFTELIKYMDEYAHVGALTVRVRLPDGDLDPASHRGFPTLWRSFSYFTGLEKILGRAPLLNNIFGGYHLLDRDFKTIHDIDSPSGAFFMTRKDLMDKLDGFDEDFFMYGEDIDLSYRIKRLGYAVVYYPQYSVTHLKYVSGLKNTDDQLQKKIRDHFYDAMKIFYNKHYKDTYPSLINKLIFTCIDIKKSL